MHPESVSRWEREKSFSKTELDDAMQPYPREEQDEERGYDEQHDGKTEKGEAEDEETGKIICFCTLQDREL